jgi:iron complex transport system ATP-binding protein
VTLIEAENLTYAVDTSKRLVDSVSLAVAAGEIVGLIGPNGAGKTTLLNMLAGVLAPTAGRVRWRGQDLSSVGPRERARQTGYLEQGQVCHWPLAVERVVALGRIPHRRPFVGESAGDRQAMATAMRQCDVEAFAGRGIDTLSGGERARVFLARVLAGEPRLILADEPVADLDPGHQLAVLNLLQDLARSGLSVVLVLHDLVLAGRFCQRLFLLDRGRLVAQGAPRDVLTDETVADTYKVSLARGEWNGVAYALPWQVRDTAETERRSAQRV